MCRHGAPRGSIRCRRCATNSGGARELQCIWECERRLKITVGVDSRQGWERETLAYSEKRSTPGKNLKRNNLGKFRPGNLDALPWTHVDVGMGAGLGLRRVPSALPRDSRSNSCAQRMLTVARSPSRTAFVNSEKPPSVQIISSL